jgi:hypothetical protein
VFCDVDGLAGEVWRSGVALSRRRIAVDAYQVLLKFDSADRGVHLQ